MFNMKGRLQNFSFTASWMFTYIPWARWGYESHTSHLRTPGMRGSSAAKASQSEGVIWTQSYIWKLHHPRRWCPERQQGYVIPLDSFIQQIVIEHLPCTWVRRKSKQIGSLPSRAARPPCGAGRGPWSAALTNDHLIRDCDFAEILEAECWDTPRSQVLSQLKWKRTVISVSSQHSS